MIQELPLTHVFSRKDARITNDEALGALVGSIREIGIINPLRVRPARRMVDGIEADAFEVTAGAHRLKAARKIGLETIPCIVVNDDDLHAELAMIDENLMRAELSAADRVSQTYRRKAIYEELHPETKHGGDRKSDQVANLATRFTADTAKVTGKSERSVQRDAELGKKICDDAISLIRGTELDTISYLDKLKAVDPAEQVSAVQRALSGVAKRLEREREEVAKSRSQAKLDADIKRRCDRANAERVIEFLPHETLEAFISDLFGAGHKTLAVEIKNMVGESIMDTHYAEAS